MNDELNVETQNNYNWNRPLIPGSLVCSSYSTFDGERVCGIFMILYDESLDNNIQHKMNCVALKVTSQQTLVDSYVVPISQEYNNYLDKPCMVCCSKTHVLSKNKEIYKYLGQLDSHTYRRVVKTYKKWSNELDRQLLDRI